MFDELAHPTLGDTTSTKDLHSVARGVLPGLRAEHLQETDLASEVLALLLV